MLRPGKDKGLATPLPLGLAALGATTFLMGIGTIFQTPAALSPYATQALLFGGMAELLAGMWAFAYGDPLAATTFTFMGAFFGWWGFTQMHLLTLIGHPGAAMTIGNSAAMVFLVTGVLVVCFWIASFYEFATFNLVLLFLAVDLILTAVAIFAEVDVVRILAGISGLISGVIAAYAAFAEIYNSTSLEEVVPVGESKEVRARVEHDEMERIRRLYAGNRVDREPEAPFRRA